MNEPKKGNFKDFLIKHDVSASIGDVYNTKERIVREIDAYLSAPNTLNFDEELSKYPNVRELFLMYNCIRSSEAICERMFSYAGNVFVFNFSIYFDIWIYNCTQWLNYISFDLRFMKVSLSYF